MNAAQLMLVVMSGVVRRPCSRLQGNARIRLFSAGLLVLLISGCNNVGVRQANDTPNPLVPHVASTSPAAPGSLKKDIAQLLPARRFAEPPDDPARLEKLNKMPELAEQYVIGPADEIEISVYNAVGLDKRQAVRPDGRIEFPFVGELRVAGLTPEQVRHRLVKALEDSIDRPEVTVIITDYNGLKFSVSGAVRSPGTFDAAQFTRLADALAMAGGLGPNADLRGSVLVRDGEILPVSLHRLLNERDLGHNVIVRPRDTIYVPDVSTRRALVLGEVKAPTVMVLDTDLTLLDAITRAQGFARGAKTTSVLVVRGSLDTPEVITVDVDAFLAGEVASDTMRTASNIALQPGDVVYVPKTAWATFADFLGDLGVSNQLSYIVRQPSAN